LKRCARTGDANMAQAYGENLKQAMDTLRTHKLRSSLTVFGVVLGVSVIMLVAALITGFDQQIQENIKQFGADTAFVTKWDQGRHGGPPPLEERQRKPLTVEDAKALQESCPAVKNVTAFLMARWDQVHSVRTKAGEVTAIDFRGVQPNFGQVYANAATLQGRFISEGDDLHKEKVVMLGENVAPVLFPDGQAVGKDVMIDGSDFLVIGVVEKPKGGFGMGDEDRRVLIPFSTFHKIYPMADELNIRMQAFPKVLNQAVDQAREVLERRRKVPYGGKDNFSIETAEQQVAEFHNIVGMVALAMVVLSSIGLLVGGIGVMNIMLVSVTERTREIGVRKAIGAKSRDITWQFLLEAMTLTGAGGVIALILVNALVLLIQVALKWPGRVPLWAAVTGIAVSVSVGLVFGVWPAMKAAKLDPVEALRYE
jgi:putative ABC transport system permease protein